MIFALCSSHVTPNQSNVSFGSRWFKPLFLSHDWLFSLRGKPYSLFPLERAPSCALGIMFAISSHESDDVALWAATAALLYALVLKMLDKKWVVTSKHGGLPSHPDSALEAQSRVVSILNISNGQSIALILLFLGNYGLFCNMCQ